MPIILTSQIQSSLEPKIGFLTHYLHIPKKIFSETYLIPNNTSISATIENIGIWESYEDYSISFDMKNDFSEIIEELIEKSIDLRFVKIGLGQYDRLWFESDSWEYLRDYGILSGYHFIRIRIDEVIYEEQEDEETHEIVLEVFPKRDVKIVIK